MAQFVSFINHHYDTTDLYAHALPYIDRPPHLMNNVVDTYLEQKKNII